MTPSRSLNSGEIAAALLVCALGGFLAWQGSGYPMGSVNRMGPGFFPVGLGIILMGFGAALVLEVRHLDTPPPEWHVRSFVAIMAGLLAFVLMLEPFGLVPATAALAVLSALGDRTVRPRAIAATALAISGIGYFVFLRGFGVQLDAFRW